MWPLGEGDDVHQTRLQSMLSRIFSDRIRKKVREELGLAYSPYVMCSPSSVFPSAGFYLGYVGTSPETADQVTAIVQQIGQDLADKGVTDDEFKQVQLPALESIKTRRKTNEYWLESVLPGCASETWRLAASADMVDYYTNMTKEMLLPVAKKYLQSGSAFRCWILPANYKPAAEPAEKKAA